MRLYSSEYSKSSFPRLLWLEKVPFVLYPFYQFPFIADLKMPRAYSEPRRDPRYEYRTPAGQTYITPPGLSTPPVLVRPPAHIRQPGHINPPAPRPYHGPHFEKGPAQEELWNARGSTQVWDPYQPMHPVAARPETRGRAHSYHQSRIESQISDPYEKRPMPYTARTAADHKAYKGPSEGHGRITVEVARAKAIPVGRKHVPSDSAREGIMHGKELAKSGRVMANVYAKSFSYITKDRN